MRGFIGLWLCKDRVNTFSAAEGGHSPACGEKPLTGLVRVGTTERASQYVENWHLLHSLSNCKWRLTLTSRYHLPATSAVVFRVICGDIPRVAGLWMGPDTNLYSGADNLTIPCWRTSAMQCRLQLLHFSIASPECWEHVRLVGVSASVPHQIIKMFFSESCF